ncbi:MAG: prolipoprotein diacylglyceryl transferase [Acidobacteria bacterium]|nr:prolipoprotein diacylglyceryl transferase [Acidobacteriota bacterium]
MFPELFKIPGTEFTLNTYGLLQALGFLAGILLMARLAEREGISRQRAYDLGLWLLASSLIGSKLLLVITEWSIYYRDNPRDIFSLDFLRSGGVFYGGLIGAVLTSFVVAKVFRLSWLSIADVAAPGIAIGTAIGRLGCFAAGCCWGKPTTAAIGVHFTDKAHELTGVPLVVAHLRSPVDQGLWAERLGDLLSPINLHPTQLYEAGATLLLTGLLLLAYKRRQFKGQVILTYAILYGSMRFAIEYLRDDWRGELLGLSTSQFISLLIILLAVPTYLLFLTRWRRTTVDH